MRGDTLRFVIGMTAFTWAVYRACVLIWLFA